MAKVPDPISPDELKRQSEERTRLGRLEVEQLDAQALSWKNVLLLQLKVNKQRKDSVNFGKQIVALSESEQKNADKYRSFANDISRLEKQIAEQRKKGTTQADTTAKRLERQLKARKAQ